MHTSDFDYELPAELIAREPVRPRDTSRMMLLDRRSNTFTDSRFTNLPSILRSGDVLVINDTRVIKARLHGELRRTTGTHRQIEVLFANPLDAMTWEVLCKPGKRIRPGDRVYFADGLAAGTFGDAREHGLRSIQLDPGMPAVELLERFGEIPLPPYIERGPGEADTVEYQTVFAHQAGAVAAPTAGLHFTPEIIDRLMNAGIEMVRITLHVGIGTFLPVRVNDPREHRLKAEWFNISEQAASRLEAARGNGRRIIAVGTTSTRTLEYVAHKNGGRIVADSGYADAYILPGYRFRAIDGLLTNFHLPRSTLLMLVSAFASHELVFAAYNHAISQRYRFYSYGDCMLIF
jgi:S-adenosylmethionine:tRNA ribosyltransferase-isomerase